MIMFASIASTMTVTESEFARVMLSVYVRVCVCVYLCVIFCMCVYVSDGTCVLAGGRSKYTCIYHVATGVLVKKLQLSHNR